MLPVPTQPPQLLPDPALGGPQQDGQPSPTAPQLPALSQHFHDVTVIKRKTTAKARVQGVPPEEFGIERQARSIKDCGYCFHRVIRRQSDLISEGFDEEDVQNLPTYVMQTGTEELSRDTVNENTGTGGDKGINLANRFVRIIEHYVRMNYEGTSDGKSKLYRVVTGGEVGEVLRRNGKPEIIETDDIPFASMTPVPITHRFFGKSIADLVMDIQRIKTALTRGLLDNTYRAVNQRPIISETDSSESTLDDVLVSRPGAPIRGKTPNAVTYQNVPLVADQVLPAIQYMDETREWRTGVARQGQGPDPNALANQNATAANLQFTAAQSKMKLIARIFAETGIRDLFSLLHETVRKHCTQAQVIRLRNQWVSVDPREWKRRDDMTIHVGMGSGSKTEQAVHMQSILGLQQAALQGGKSNLVSDQNLYHAASDFARLVGAKNANDRYFTDPTTVPPPQPQPDPRVMEIQMKGQLDQQQAQHKAQLDTFKAQTDYEHQQAQGVANAALAEHKMKMDAMTADREHQYRMLEMERQHQYKLAEMTAKATHSANDQAQKGQQESQEQQANRDHLAPLLAELMDHLRKSSAPKRIIRDENGRAVGVEPVH